MKLVTGKVDDLRVYHAKTERIFEGSKEEILKAIISFDKRCNNEFKDLRKVTDKKQDCPFHNPLIIETQLHPVINTKNKSERYVVTRYVNNRGQHVINELISIDNVRQNGKNKIIMKIRSINDKKMKELTGKDLKSKMVLKKTWAKYVITEVEENKAKLEYAYEMETDHWLVNKIIAASTVFDNLFKNMNQFIKTLDLQLKKI